MAGAGAAKTLGVDVGGTKIAAGVVDASGRVLSKVRYPSAGPPETLLQNVLRVVHHPERTAQPEVVDVRGCDDGVEYLA